MPDIPDPKIINERYPRVPSRMDTNPVVITCPKCKRDCRKIEHRICTDPKCPLRPTAVF